MWFFVTYVEQRNPGALVYQSALVEMEPLDFLSGENQHYPETRIAILMAAAVGEALPDAFPGVQRFTRASIERTWALSSASRLRSATHGGGPVTVDG